MSQSLVLNSILESILKHEKSIDLLCEGQLSGICVMSQESMMTVRDQLEITLISRIKGLCEGGILMDNIDLETDNGQA